MSIPLQEGQERIAIKGTRYRRFSFLGGGAANKHFLFGEGKCGGQLRGFSVKWINRCHETIKDKNVYCGQNGPSPSLLQCVLLVEEKQNTKK